MTTPGLLPARSRVPRPALQLRKVALAREWLLLDGRKLFGLGHNLGVVCEREGVVLRRLCTLSFSLQGCVPGVPASVQQALATKTPKRGSHRGHWDQDPAEADEAPGM